MKTLMKYDKYFILIIFSIVITLAFIEVVLRLNPGLTPNWYKKKYPPNAIEVFYPGTLAKTPISGVPIPYDLGPRYIKQKGKVFSDIAGRGLLDPTQNPDLLKYNQIEFRIDKNGFINPDDIARPDIVFIGDSFTFATGSIHPKGLLLQLEQAADLKILSIAVPGIGPQREEWLLNNIVLPLKPKAVIWFFFGGNDIDDAEHIENYRAENIQNYAQIYKQPSAPRIITLDLIYEFTKTKFSEYKEHKNKEKNYLPGFVLNNDNQEELLWFLPEYIKRLSLKKTFLNNSRGWQITKEVLLRVSENLKHHNIKFLVVYIPSKPQVYLPYLDKDLELIHRYFKYPENIKYRQYDDKDNLIYKEGSNRNWNASLENRNNLEEIVKKFCESEKISFLSLTPQLENLASQGQLGYFSADTHWNEIGQSTAVKPLKKWINKNLKN